MVEKYQLSTAQQRTQWNRFTAGLDSLNRSFAKTRADLYYIQRAVDFYKSQREIFPPSFPETAFPPVQQAATKWMQAVTTLNNAFALSQSGSAFLAPSQMVPGDLDLVIEENTVPDAVRQNATFVKQSVDSDLGLAIVPLIVVGGIVIGSLVIISGIVDSITETTTKHKRLDAHIQRIKTNIEKDIVQASPDVAKKWLEYKTKEVEPVAKGFMQSAGESVGGLLGVAVIGIVLYMVWKNWAGKK